MILMSSVCEKCLKKDGCERYVQIRKMPDFIEVATCEWFVEDGIMRTKEEILDIINGVRSGNLEALETVLAALEYEGIKTVKLDPALCEAFNTILSALSQRPKTGGHWEHGKEISREYRGQTLVNINYLDWHCSNCHCVVEQSIKPEWNYCPACGAKMESEE